MIWKNGTVVELTPPHDHLTEVIHPYLPQDAMLREMQKRSYEILANHPINQERRAKGLNPANSLWFWGAGTKPMRIFRKIWVKRRNDLCSRFAEGDCSRCKDASY